MKSFYAILVALTLLLCAADAHALIEVSKGNAPVQNKNWPKGSEEVGNQACRLGFWVGPPFGGGEHHFEFRGTSDEFQAAIDSLAKIDAPKVLLVVHEGPGESFVLKGEKNPKDKRCDWTFTVWDPAVFNKLYNDPKNTFMAMDPSGNFRQSVAPPRIDVFVGGAPAGEGVDWSGVKVPKNVTVRNERASANGYPADAGSVLRGHVTDAITSKPLAGAKVVVAKYGQEKRDYENVMSATADAEGKFELKKIPPHEGYRVHVAAEGYAMRMLGYAKIGADTLKEYPSVTLSPALEISGIVKDTAGKPVRDVELRIDATIGVDGKSYLMPEKPGVKTDASGKFSFDGLPKGTCALRARAKGYHTVEPLKMQSVPARDAVFLMAQTGNVRGKVVQRDAGAPTDGEYIVNIEPEGGNKVGSWGGGTTMKNDGAFEFTDVPPGKYMINARPNPGRVIKGKDPSEKLVEIKPGETLEVEINVK